MQRYINMAVFRLLMTYKTSSRDSMIEYKAVS